jgi:hypothetical protein
MDAAYWEDLAGRLYGLLIRSAARFCWSTPARHLRNVTIGDPAQTCSRTLNMAPCRSCRPSGGGAGRGAVTGPR